MKYLGLAAMMFLTVACEGGSEEESAPPPACGFGNYNNAGRCEPLPGNVAIEGAAWLVQSGHESNDAVRGVAAASDGSIFLLENRMGPSAPGGVAAASLRLQKLTGDGSVVSESELSGAVWSQGSAIALAASGQVVVAGLEGVSGVGTAQPFVAPFSPTDLSRGNGYRFSGSGAQPVALQCSGSGCVVLGTVRGVIEGQRSQGKADIFVARMKADFSGLEWIRILGTSEEDEGVSLHVRDEEIVVLGATRHVVSGSATSGGIDAVTYRLSWDGATLQQTQFGTKGDDLPASVAVAADGSVVVVGATSGRCADSDPKGANVFFWARAPGSDAESLVCSGSEGDDFVASATWVASAERFVIAGSTSGFFAPLTKSFGERDVFLAAVPKSTGLVVSPRQFGTVLSERPSALAQVGSEWILAGETEGNFTKPRQGRTDLFVVKLPSP